MGNFKNFNKLLVSSSLVPSQAHTMYEGDAKTHHRVYREHVILK
jgi:hypothetical protein